MSSMEPQPDKQTIVSTLDQVVAVVDKLAGLGTMVTGNPLLMGALSLVVRGIASIARRNGIDPGPFDSRVASLEAVIDRGIKNDEEYRKRHGE
jgi:hypothetical protein